MPDEASWLIGWGGHPWSWSQFIMVGPCWSWLSFTSSPQPWPRWIHWLRLTVKPTQTEAWLTDIYLQLVMNNWIVASFWLLGCLLVPCWLLAYCLVVFWFMNKQPMLMANCIGCLLLDVRSGQFLVKNMLRLAAKSLWSWRLQITVSHQLNCISHLYPQIIKNMHQIGQNISNANLGGKVTQICHSLRLWIQHRAEINLVVVSHEQTNADWYVLCWLQSCIGNRTKSCSSSIVQLTDAPQQVHYRAEF